jgi:putative endonuclease
MWHVYIPKCNDESYYTGCTSDIADRLHRHNSGDVTSTSSRLPVNLAVTISFTDKYKEEDLKLI